MRKFREFIEGLLHWDNHPNDLKIRSILEELHRQLPSKRTAVVGWFELPLGMRSATIRSGYSQSSLQDIANLMGAFLGVPLAVQVKVVDRFSGGKTAGLYKVHGQFQRTVEIVRNPAFGIENYLAILAHESTHHYLYEYRIRKENEHENEMLTDLAAVYIGFGPLLFLGYQTISSLNSFERTQSSTTLGYVSPHDIRTAARIVVEMRGNELPRDRSSTSYNDESVIYLGPRSDGK